MVFKFRGQEINNKSEWVSYFFYPVINELGDFKSILKVRKSNKKEDYLGWYSTKCRLDSTKAGEKDVRFMEWRMFYGFLTLKDLTYYYKLCLFTASPKFRICGFFGLLVSGSHFE